MSNNEIKVLIDLRTFERTHCGGKDEVAYNLLRGFSELGHTSQIIVCCCEELVSLVKEIDSNYQIVVLPKYKKKKKIDLVGRTFNSFLWGKNLAEIIKKEKINIVLFTNKRTPIYTYKVPTIVIPHDIQAFVVKDFPELKQIYNPIIAAKHRIIIKFDFALRDYIIAISDFDKECILKYLPKYKNKIIRIYDPIKFREVNIKSSERKYITALNIQWGHKNIETLIDAYQKIANKISYDLMLVGKLPQNGDELKNRIKKANLENRVTFTGFVDDEELKEIISKTRIYINSSLFEGFGMTAVEMMGNKIPTIVAKTTALGESTMGLCRYYFPPKDSDNLAKEIMEEIETPTSDEKLESIKGVVRKEFSYLKIAQEYWELLIRSTNCGDI